ncbi:nucleosome assembly protein 1;2-like [Rosa rugosa]|uniref:nucleosome assembly protein 1;2-like n=1 Tax=Rosa rugosa TaxID=74645 RepID=UPI002B406985|nr:nucleosome assembly protein 1;2-like [Rosa rugosa]
MTKITTKHSNFLDSLSPGVKKHVNVLKNIQSDHDELKKLFYKERPILEAKYQNLFQNLYIKRCDIVNGFVQANKVSNDSEASINQVDITKQDVEAPEDHVFPNLSQSGLVWFMEMKTCEFLDEDEAIVHKVTGLKIEWYPKNCLTSRVIKKPMKELKIVDIRPEQYIPRNTDEMRRDLYIGLTIRDEIIPRAGLWYVGEGAQEEMEIYFGESEDEEGEN